MKRLFVIIFILSVAAEMFGPGPHPVYVEIRNSQNEIPVVGDITFLAWLLSNPEEILDENVTDCYYPAFTSCVKINCGQFLNWNEGDILHLEVTEISSNESGTGEYVLNLNASQFFYMDDGGIYLGGIIIPPDLELPVEFITDEDTELSVNFSEYITGLYSAIVSGGGENISVGITGSTVVFIPASNWNGSEVISFEVIGLGGENDTDDVVMVVTAVNDAPVLNLPQHFQFNEDGSFSVDIEQYASDIEEDLLSFAVEGSEHITAEIAGTQLYLEAETDWNGIEYITVIVSDDQRRETTSSEVMVIINPVNDTPSLELPEQLTFRAEIEATVDFQLFMEDIDGDDLEISVYGEDELIVEIDGSVVSFEYTAGWHGSEELIFTVNDNILRATDSDTVMINIFYPEDTIFSCDDYEIDDGQPLTVQIQTTEIFEEWSAAAFILGFNYNPLVLDYSGFSLANSILPLGAIEINEEVSGELVIEFASVFPIDGSGILLELDFTGVCFGVSELSFEYCLMSGYNLTNFQDGEVIVNNIGLQHPPVADAGDDFGVMSGGNGTVDGSGSYDPDGDEITYLWDAPPDIILEDETAMVTGFTAPIVAEDTEYIIVLTVSDGMYDTNDFVTVTVNYMNYEPEIDLPTEFSFEEDGELELDFSEYVYDPDGDPVLITVTGNENILVEINEMEVLISAEANWYGTETLTFTVDDCIQRPSDEVNIIVTPVNDIPHADAGMDQNGRDGEVITLNGSASWDVETEELEYLWLAPAGIMLNDPYAENPFFTAPQVVDPTELEFTLQVSDGEASDEDLVVITIQDDEPVLLHVDLLPDNNALFTWFAPGSGGSGQELEQGFEGIVPPQGWTNIDHDGDGYGWYIYVQNPHSGTSSIGSQSYSPSGGALTPDNWLISPTIQVGGLSELHYWIAAQDVYHFAEHYSVLVSTQGVGLENFEDILIEETLSNTNWAQHTFSLMPWAGSTINIAWRHHDVTDQFILKLDDVQILNSGTRAIEFQADFENCETAITNSQAAFRERDLLGYNVFLDTVLQNFVEIREYPFEDVIGEHLAGVQAVYDNGGESEIVTKTFDHTANNAELPMVTGLNRIFPNPFNPEVKIEFSLKNTEHVCLNVYNIKGQKVADILDEELTAGRYSRTWKADGLPSAIYFLQMQADEYNRFEKLILLK